MTELYVTPGDRLGNVEDYMPGEGTYVRHQHIYASVLGVRQIIQKDDSNDGDGDVSMEQKPVISVINDRRPPTVPIIGDTVIGKVIRVNPRFASVSIMCVGDKALKETSSGIIRVQDVRATEADKVEIYKSFRPGDIVRAEIISLGDSRSYFLSTAKNELGVVIANSVAGARMIPISWAEMQCPKTKMKEYRKVAKVVPTNNQQ